MQTRIETSKNARRNQVKRTSDAIREHMDKRASVVNEIRDALFLRDVRAAAAAARPAEIAQRVAAAAAAEWQAEQAAAADADFLAMVRERIAAARPHMIAQRAAYDYARTVAVETRRAVARRAA